MADDAALRARLEDNYTAFESILSLTPAKFYYGESNDDQWQRKKQTKEEKRDAKVAKLDPENYKTALDVHRENERKRKRELGLEDASTAEEVAEENQVKKMKKTHAPKVALTPEEDERIRQEKAQKRKDKRNRKQEKKNKAKERKAAKKAGTTDQPQQKEKPVNTDKPKQAQRTPKVKSVIAEQSLEVEDDKDDDSSDSMSEAEADTPTFDITQHSSASSTSSIVPPSKAETEEKQSIDSEDEDTPMAVDLPALIDEPKVEKSPKALHLPQIDAAVLKKRLEDRMAEFRAARRADGPDGRPARSRQDLIDARRQKQERRKQNKKEQRAQAKKIQNEAEAEAARLRGGSGSPLWATPSVLSPSENKTSFSFSKLTFDDGSNLAGTELLQHKTKGATDTKTALQIAQNKEQRLSGMSADKRKDIEEKDMWLNAKKKINREKVRDDTSLLKKALKRQEKIKDKSEKEWKTRVEGVEKSIEARQRKREDNLQKRRDEKGGKKGKAKGPPKKRPGFEGNWKTGTRKSTA